MFICRYALPFVVACYHLLSFDLVCSRSLFAVDWCLFVGACCLLSVAVIGCHSGCLVEFPVVCWLCVVVGVVFCVGGVGVGVGVAGVVGVVGLGAVGAVVLLLLFCLLFFVLLVRCSFCV